MQNETNSIYRKPDCPHGKKAVKLLNDFDIEYEDHLLSSEDEVQEFKKVHHVETTPQVFIDHERIGGYTELSEKFHASTSIKDDKKSYTPIIAIFFTTVVLSLSSGSTVMGFMCIFLSILATLKLMDLTAFEDAFVKYDLLAMNFKVYAKVFPFAELMIASFILSGLLIKQMAVLSLCIGTLGAISIYKSVYIDKKELNCACVGGNSNVPLGKISIVENFFMILMGLWLLI